MTKLSGRKIKIMKNTFNDDLIDYLKKIDNKKIDQIYDKIMSNKKKIIIIGNGGSASIASHFSIDFNKNFQKQCLNFSDHSMLTCLANDYGYENWVKEVIKVHCNEGDILISISSSGESLNIINGILEAKNKNAFCISLTGFEKDNKVSQISDLSFWVNSKSYNVIETIHLIVLLNIIEKFKIKKKY